MGRGAPGWLSWLSAQLQLRISQFVSSSPASGSADSSEPGACFRFCVFLSLCSSPTRALSLSLSLSLSKINTKKNFFKVSVHGPGQYGAQAMILWFLSSGPTSDSADSSEPGACFRFCVSLSLCAPPPLVLCLCLSQE